MFEMSLRDDPRSIQVVPRDAGRQQSRALAVRGMLIVVGLSAIYLTTAPMGSWTHDPLTNTLTAWSLGTRGSVELVEYQDLVEDDLLGGIVGFIRGRMGPVSIYPPGPALHAAPLYALLRPALRGINVTTVQGVVLELLVPPLWPGVLVAAVATALSMGVLFVAFCRLGTARSAMIGAAIAGLGTAAWSVSSQALWQHGPAMLWVAVAIAAEPGFIGATAWALAALTRPHTALISLLQAGYGALARWGWRTWVPLIGALAGLGALAWFNWRMLGEATIAGGYAGTGQITFPNTDLAQWGRNIVGALFDVRRGLILSPFLIALAPGIPRAWKAAPAWVRGAALGGVAYFLIQYNAHDFHGGDRFFGYRYQLEALVAWAPLLFLSFQAWVRVSGLRQLMFWIGVGVSIGLQAYGATHPYSF